MSNESCCAFCDNLPSVHQPGWGGASRKCPMCKTELWTSQAGKSFRLGGAPVPAKGKRWHFASGFGIVVVALVFAGIVRRDSGADKHPVADKPATTIAVPHQAKAVVVSSAGNEKPIPKAWVKPALFPVVVARAKPAVAAPIENPTPPEKVARVETPPRVAEPTRPQFSTNGMEALLQKIPEVDLDPDFRMRSKSAIKEKARLMLDEAKGDHDAFVRNMVKDRRDLAGLPFAMGDDCKLDTKKSKDLTENSVHIRMELANALQERSKYSSSPRHEELVSKRILGGLYTGSIPAMRQILAVEQPALRARFVDALNPLRGVEASEGIVNRALFDTDDQVRSVAIAQLQGRPVDEFLPAIKKALRYPWLPVVQNAGAAIAKLKLKEAIPELVTLLDEHAPDAPFTVKDGDGKDKHMVRELVRINHHRNCMLCHTPLDVTKLTREERRQVPVGPVPSPDDPLPPIASTVYYSERSGNTLVRADVTYLRQDFSLLQPVSDPGKWSELQRYDFLVRNREITAKEAAERPMTNKNYSETTLATLRIVTGRNLPADSKAWRAAIDRQ